MLSIFQVAIFFVSSYSNRATSLSVRFKNLLLIGVLCIVQKTYAATITSNAVTGNWTTGSSWVGGIAPGAADMGVIVSGANITINANITIGSIQINSGGIINGLSSNIILLNNWTNNGTFNYGTSTILFNGTGSQTINGGTASFHHIIVNNTNGAPGMGVSSHPVNLFVYGNFQNNGVFNRNNTSFPAAKVTFAGNTIVSGTNALILHNVDIVAGATLNGATGLSGGTFDMYFTGTWNNLGTFNPGTGNVTVQFSSANTTQQIISGASPFYNLSVNKNVIVAPLGNVTIQNNLTITTGTLSASNFTINVGGDFTNLSLFNAGTGLVNFNGTTNQNINAGISTFYNLKINKSTGNVLQLSDIQVTNNITLTNGKIYTYTNPSNLFELYLSNSATNSLIGGSVTSCVIGNLRRDVLAGTGIYSYPLGVLNTSPVKYRPISYNQTSAGGATNINMLSDTTYPAPVKTANWFVKITSNAGNPIAKITLNYNLGVDFLAGTQECILNVLRGQASTASNWNHVLQTVTSATGGSNGFITSNLPTVLNPFGYIIGEALPVSSNINICEGSTATLFANSPTGSSHFNWYDAATGGTLLQADSSTYLTPIISSNATYYLEFVDSLSNCKSPRVPVSVNITTAPSSAFSVQDTTCLGANGLVTFLGTVSASGTYYWNFDGGIVVSGSGSSNYQVYWNTPGTKNITLSIIDNPCSSTLTVHSIEVAPTPSQPTLTTSNYAVCKGDSVTLTAGGSLGGNVINYSFYDSLIAGTYLGTSPLKVQVSDTSTFYLAVTNEFGCKSKPSRDSITIVINKLPFLSSPYSDDIKLCYGDSTLLFVNLTQPPQANVYWWDNSVGGNFVSGNDSIYTGALFQNKTYWAEAITPYGCTNGGRIPVSVIISPYPVITLQTGLTNNTAQSGFNVTVEASPAGYSTYEFYINNILVQTSTNNTYSSDQFIDGDKITAIAINETCRGVASDALTIKVLPIANAFTPNGDGVNDIFLKGFELSIFNRWGELLFDGTSGWDGTFKGAKVSPGTYFYIYKKHDASGNIISINGPVTLIDK
jgi:gliding motility-associated-like protein